MKKTDSTFIWVTTGDLCSGSYSDPRKFKALLKMAKELAPSILFAEDIDDYLGSKSSVDAIKTQMDGLDSMDGVVTILCTNYPKRIPKSLIDRPSRFDEVVMFKLPNENLRYEILSENLKSVNVENKESSIKKIAKDSEGLTGAHLKEIVIYSILLASDADREDIKFEDLKASLKKVKKTRELIDNINEEKSYVKNIRNKGGIMGEVDEKLKKSTEEEIEEQEPQDEETIEEQEDVEEESKTEEPAEEIDDEVEEEESEKDTSKEIEKTLDDKIDDVLEKLNGIEELLKSIDAEDTKDLDEEEPVEEEEEPQEETEEEPQDDETEEPEDEIEEESEPEKNVTPKRKGILQEDKSDENDNILEQLKGKTASEIMEDRELWKKLSGDVKAQVMTAWSCRGNK